MGGDMLSADAIERSLTGRTVVVVGAGIGGLAGALHLSALGAEVTVVEAAAGPGGKIRTVPSVAGPVDAGPTVLTLRPVFAALFAAAGARLEDHLRLEPLEIIARHYWEDGTAFDLMADPAATERNLSAAFGAAAASEYRTFRARADRLFEAFDAPMMQTARPRITALAGQVLAQPRLVADMAPWRSLAGALARQFRDPRLRQLFGRYATYVGGSPYASPALLALVSASEARGVWRVDGGMAALAAAIEALARTQGVRFLYGTRVQRIELQGGRAAGVATTAGRIRAEAVLFNGDPRALATGLLGEGVRRSVPASGTEPRSLSALVHAFAAEPSGPDLAHHTVFFGTDTRAEFGPLSEGRRPDDATLYVCAQDRTGTAAPGGPERFEIILNAPPQSEADGEDQSGEIERCQSQVRDRLRSFGLTFDPRPGQASLTTPSGFRRLHPGSLGSLYGRSPHGLMAALRRPGARTAVPGLYLCGGGVHPGPGLPMATLSARHAAEAIKADLASTSPSRRTGTPGGIWTGFPRTGRGRSPSSAS